MRARLFVTLAMAVVFLAVARPALAWVAPSRTVSATFGTRQLQTPTPPVDCPPGLPTPPLPGKPGCEDGVVKQVLDPVRHLLDGLRGTREDPARDVSTRPSSASKDETGSSKGSKGTASKTGAGRRTVPPSTTQRDTAPRPEQAPAQPASNNTPLGHLPWLALAVGALFVTTAMGLRRLS